MPPNGHGWDAPSADRRGVRRRRKGIWIVRQAGAFSIEARQHFVEIKRERRPGAYDLPATRILTHLGVPDPERLAGVAVALVDTLLILTKFPSGEAP